MTAAIAVIAAVPAAAGSPRPVSRWSATWATAPQPPVAGDGSTANWSMPGFADQTVRQVLRVSSGGDHVRVRLSNVYGTRPLRVSGATIAATAAGAEVRPGTVHRLTFHGARSATVPAGGTAASDAVDLPVTPLESLSISVYLPGPTGPATFHEDGQTTTYRATGRHADSAAFIGPTSHSYYFLTGVDVAGHRKRGTVVTFGDSITNGHNSTVDGNDRYPDALAERLAAARRPMGVANAGITGNLLLSALPCYGAEGIARFRRDALDQPGVRTVIALEGSNDIWDSEGAFGCGTTRRITAAQLITGYRGLITAAHDRGIRIIGGTILPFKASYMSRTDFERAETIRQAVNGWIRTSGAYDAVVDFDRALADPADPEQLNPVYNSGDGLHPNDAGYRAMANAVNLDQL